MPQKFPCKITQIVDHGDRIYSLFLEPEGQTPRFLAGQFLHLALDEYLPGDFWPESRPFSIASSPFQRKLLRITYAVKGKFTTRMEAELKLDSTVWVKMPYGEFIVNGQTDICLVAGGTGITAFTAFLASLNPTQPHQVYLFYGARSPQLLVYRSVVEEAVRCCPDLHAYFLSEQSVEGMDCLPGRIEVATIWKWVPDPLTVSFYISGPPEMLNAVSDGLIQRGVAPNKLFKDAW